MKRILSFALCLILVLSLSSCEKFDENYGKSSAAQETADTTPKEQDKEIQIPNIVSDDSVMPTYFDISLYDEENYADIYLGDKFEYQATYVGSVLSLPTSYKKITKDGWLIPESSEYNEDSQILAGKSVSVELTNEYGKMVTAVFYNGKKSSATLKKCPIVKFIIKENGLLVPESSYGQFWINGVSNVSAITDIIEFLGSPSHFYRVSENKYYLDWFITKSDRRSGITVYVDTAEDHIDSIEISYY